jgi:hypothetical protein
VLDTLWKNLFQQHPLPSPRERSHTGSITTCTGQPFTRSPSLLVYPVNREYRLGPLQQAQPWQQGLTVFISRIAPGTISAGNYPDSLPGRMAFPIHPAQDRLTLWCRECVTDNPRKGQRRFRRFRRCTGCFCRGQICSSWQSVNRTGEENPPQHGSSRLTDFIAWSGLTLSPMLLHAFR